MKRHSGISSLYPLNSKHPLYRCMGIQHKKYTTLTNFSTKYLVMYKVCTILGNPGVTDSFECIGYGGYRGCVYTNNEYFCKPEHSRLNISWSTAYAIFGSCSIEMFMLNSSITEHLEFFINQHKKTHYNKYIVLHIDSTQLKLILTSGRF